VLHFPCSCQYSAVSHIRDQWLMWSPEVRHAGTPFGHIHHVLHIISRRSYSLGTATCFDFSNDGQTMRHSVDQGVNWNNVDFSLWPKLVNNLMEQIEEHISWQLPESLTISSLLTNNVMDDLSPNAPHMQTENSIWMTNNATLLKVHMLHQPEARHSLMLNGTLQLHQVEKYLQRDQEIRGLIAALMATTTGLCLRPFQYKSIKIGSDAKNDRNIWILEGRFLFGKPAAKQLSVGFADTLFWLPRRVTRPLSVFFYFLQPFIDDTLDKNTLPVFHPSLAAVACKIGNEIRSSLFVEWDRY
jgi:hypothetical protein